MSLDTWLGLGICAVALVLAVLPPHLDPAIRWKERQKRRSGDFRW